MAPRFSSFLSPKCEVRSAFDDDNLGAYASQSITAGEILAVFGGEIMTLEQMEADWSEIQHLSLQVEDDLFLVSTYPGPGDYINHSCDPTGWLVGQIVLVARRDIQVGEMISFDYATTDGSSYDEFECLCGSPACRGQITGRDWLIPELQKRYHAHFSPYLQRKIDALQVAVGIEDISLEH